MTRQTSREAYETIKNNGMLSKRRWEAYHILYHNGPMTCGELFSHSDLKNLKGYRQNFVARLGELRDVGVVVELGTKKCSITGNNVILWDVTSNLPVKLKKEKKADITEEAIKGERRACAMIAMNLGSRKISDEILSRNNLTLF